MAAASAPATRELPRILERRHLRRGLGGRVPEVLEKTEAAWGDEDTEKFVLELIEGMKRTLKIDTNHIYLGGHSMGATAPGRSAGATPISSPD